MKPRVVAFAASAFVLYVMASVAAAGVPLDAGAISLSVLALGCALLPLSLSRAEGSLGRGTAPFDDEAQGLAAWLSSVLAVLLSGWLGAEVHPLASELLVAGCLPVAGILLLRLSFSVPDTPVRLMRHVRSEVLLRVVGAVALALGVLAALPPLWLAGRPLIAPHSLAFAPPAFGLACLLLALTLRLFRRRLGSDARALSANLWATLGVLLSLLLVLGAVALRALSLDTPGAERGTLALSAAFLSVGHVWLVSPRRALVASQWARELLALVLSFVLSAALFVLLLGVLASDTPARVMLCALVLLVFELSRMGLRGLSRALLAPHRGRLLDAIAEATDAGLGSSSYQDLAGRVLRPLRRAALSPEAAPLLLSFHPDRELRLDAAGLPRESARSLPTCVRERLLELAGDPVVRDDLSFRLIRRPELRQLVWALDELDALCVLPLMSEGQIEGALVLARGSRTDPLTLEELTALARFAEWIAATAAVFLMAERSNARLAEAVGQRSELKARVDDLSDELDELRAQSNLLKAGRAGLDARTDVVAYSPRMRELVARLTQLAADDVTLLLVSEPGTELTPLARLVHEASGRSDAPFVVGDCARLAPEDAEAALFGSRAGPGFLELAGQGTLVLLDVPALGLDAQRALARALSERRAEPTQGGAGYPLSARLVATTGRALTELVAAEAVAPELARWLEPATCLVPSLRERREDIESLVLRALDRSARVWGRSVPGVAPDALRALSDYDFPGNVQELEQLVQRAVMRASGSRITLEDLPPLPAGEPVAGSFVDQEREILRRALERAGGSRTRAARALGLKRTTLIDKLNRLGIEDGSGNTNH